MSLNENILSKEGEYVSLGKLLRAACILLEYDKKKILGMKDIVASMMILFTGEKLLHAINYGTKSIIKNVQEPDVNQNCKDKIKSIIVKYGIRSIHDNIVYGLIGIYDNIESYDEEEFEFSNEYSVEVIVKGCTLITNFLNNKLIKDKHFHIVHRILSPNIPIKISWTIPKFKENIFEESKKYTSYINITNGFVRTLIQH